MVSTYKGKVTDCSNNFAITTDGLGEALKRSSASMKTAGNTLEETIALVATANETIQNPETVGNAWKTISMRLRGLVAEDDEDGDTVWKPAKLNKLIYDTTKSQTGQGISLLADDDAFKSTYEIIKDIAKVWNQLDSKSQSGLLEKMAGKHRATVLAATLSDVERLEEAFEKASNAGNSAMNEWQKRTTSIEYAIGQLNATWQEFSQNTIPKETIVRFINLAQSALEFAEKIGVINATIGIIGGLLTSTKFLPFLDAQGRILAETTDKVKILGKEYALVGEASASFGQKAIRTFAGLGATIKTMVKALGKATLIMGAIFIAINVAEKAFEWFNRAKNDVSGLQEEIDDLTTSINSLESELEELRSKDVLTSAEKDRLEYLEKKIALEERSLELKKEEQAQEFTKDVNTYFSKGLGRVFDIDSAYEDSMEDAESSMKDFDSVTAKIERRQEIIESLQEKLSGLTVGTKEYSETQSKLKDAQEKLKDAESERISILKDMQGYLSSLYEQQSYYDNALNYCSESERAGLLAGKQYTDNLVEKMEIALGLTSTYEDLAEEVENLTPKVNKLKSTFDSAKKTNELTYAQMDELRELYPELAEKIVLSCETTETGYKIEGEALQALTDQYNSSKKALIQAEIDMTQKVIDGANDRIAMYEAEIGAISGLMETLNAQAHIFSDEYYGDNVRDDALEAYNNLTPEQKEAYNKYKKDLEAVKEAKEKLAKLQDELLQIGNGTTTGTNGDDSTSSSDSAEKTVEIWDKYANALAKMNEEVERYNANVELTQAKLDLNQSQEERTVELLEQEQHLYGDLLEAQQARYQIVNDTLWVQMQQLDVLHEQMSEKVMAKAGIKIDASELATWTAADLDEFAELHLSIDTSEVDADLKNELNYMIEMNESMNDLYVKWYELKQEKLDTIKEIMQSEIDLQDDILDKYDESRETVTQLLDLLEEVENTEDERRDLLTAVTESYEAQRKTIDEMYNSNLSLLAELAQDMESNGQAYAQLLKQQQELEKQSLEALESEYQYRVKLLELEKERAEQQAENDIYGDLGQDKWEKSRQKEIDALQDQLDELEKENEEDSYQKQLLEYQDEITEKEEEIAELYKKLDNLRGQKTIQTLKEQEDGSFQWEYVEDQQAINETLEEIADKQNEIEETRNEIKELQDEHALEMEKQAIQDKIDSIEAEVERRQELYNEQLELITDTYNKQKAVQDEWLRTEIANWESKNNAAKQYLAQYEKINVDGWRSATESTETELQALNEVYAQNFSDINNTIANYASKAIEHIRAIQAAERAAREAAAEASSSKSSKKAAGGIKFVESNNFPALLHYGERVLTRQEAQQYNDLEDDIKSGRLSAYFEAAKESTVNSISSGISQSIATFSKSSIPQTTSNTTSFVIERLELPNVQDSQDFASVLQSWARNEFGGLSQKAKIIKSK